MTAGSKRVTVGAGVVGLCRAGAAALGQSTSIGPGSGLCHHLAPPPAPDR